MFNSAKQKVISLSIRISSETLTYEQQQVLSTRVYSLLESLLKTKVTGAEGTVLVGIETKYNSGKLSLTQYNYEIEPDFSLFVPKQTDHQK